MSDLREVILSITNRCNFKCRMCDIPKNKLAELSTDQWKQTIEDAASCGAQSIVFSGGEPLLRQDIYELIEHAKSRNLGACLTSNGYLLNNKVAQKLSSVGIDVVNISIEGPRRVHDYLRGRGSFQRAIVALQNLQEYRIEATIATIVSKHNYKYLTHSLELANQYCATTVKYQPFNKLFLADRQGGDQFLLSKKEMQRLNQAVRDVVALAGKYGIATNPRGYLEVIPYYMTGQYHTIRKGCAALGYSCPINCNGDMYLCWVITGADDALGNLKEKSFSELWRSQRRKSAIEKIERSGCPVCMMSCYDMNFDTYTIEEKVVRNIRQLQKRGLRSVMRSKLKRYAKRVRFYASYRGSFKNLVRRIRGALKKKEPVPTLTQEDKAKGVLREIVQAKKMLKSHQGH